MKRFRLHWLLPLMVVAGCAGTQVTEGEGPTIEEAQAVPYDGPKARIAVGRIIDKTGKGSDSLAAHLQYLRSRGHSITSDTGAIVGGMRDMLTTALFNSNRYIVLERENISDVMVEQEFSASGQVGEATKIPMGDIEGVELLVVGALTGFDPGAKGATFPIPIPLKNSRNLPILNLSVSKSYVAMDIRVIDVRTSRVLASVAVEGVARKFGAGLGGFVGTRYGTLYLPSVLTGFTNTPMEKAINEMVEAATDNIIAKTPEVYYRY